MERGHRLKIKDLKTIKEHDVFSFSYNEKMLDELSYPNHCFDGKLITKKGDDGLYLADTYWSNDNSIFKLKEVLKEGSLTFICNLKTVKIIEEYETEYFADEDIYNLSYQHGCYKRFAINKNAKRDREKMLKVLNDRIKKAKDEIDYQVRGIESLSIKRDKVENGKLDIYL